MQITEPLNSQLMELKLLNYEFKPAVNKFVFNKWKSRCDNANKPYDFNPIY